MKIDGGVPGVKDDRKFEVQCDAGDAGGLRICAESITVKIGQRVRWVGNEEMWESVNIHCESGKDGSLSVKVMACHFDWDEPRQIALIQSKPNQNGEETRALTFDFEQRNV